MELINLIRKDGLSKVVMDYKLSLTVYDDRIVLNYDQIDSPRFNLICDQARALILSKDSFNVIARSFDRFYNLDEGVGPQNAGLQKRYDQFMEYPFEKSYVLNKLDGSLISMYFYGDTWNCATRKRAFAEGTSTFGRTFDDIFKASLNYKDIANFRNNYKFFTWVFELTSPENRVVTPYSEINATLIGARNNSNYYELTSSELDDIANKYGIPRPQCFSLPNTSVKSKEDVVKIVSQFNPMDEGVVLVYEDGGKSHWRIKCKNQSFVAIAHMRENGGISPKNIIQLIMTNDHHEYLSYFKDDKPYFDFVEKIYNAFILCIRENFEKFKNIEDQKEFALSIQEHVDPSMLGFLFNMKKGKTLDELLSGIPAKKLVTILNLKQELVKKFSGLNFDFEET
jgi:hypothetical protein